MNANELADLIDSGVFPEGTLLIATKMLRKLEEDNANLQEQFNKALDFLTKINTVRK